MDKTFTDNQGEHGRDRQESVDLQVEMARSYLDYAMSVIVGRALPDRRCCVYALSRVLSRSTRSHFNKS